ncbi:MAG TPA: SprB repeat-containing protein, partial [Bacteroidia bacterium]|nr:SprB repeat-containing protein [Bacteroidia bacterium]
MRKSILLIIFLLEFVCVVAQPPIQWQRCLGGTDEERIAEGFGWGFGDAGIEQTTDSGYIIVGSAKSNDGDVSGNHSSIVSPNLFVFDYWVVKLNSGGTLQWQKCLGGVNYDYGYSVQQTFDGGYIVCGQAKSTDGDVIGNHGGYDYWVVKLSPSGSVQWKKCYGGTLDDYGYSIRQTTDGGYIVAGSSQSVDGDVIMQIGNFDFWIIKLDAAGNILWQKSLGGTEWDWTRSIRQTTDGGYIIAGNTYSNNGNVNGWHPGYNSSGGILPDGWLVKIDSAGNLQWQKCLGGSHIDELRCVRQTADGGYIVAGNTGSDDGDVTGWHPGYALFDSAHIADKWVVKLDSNGNIQWQKCLGGSRTDGGASVYQTTDGGYIVQGRTGSNDGDVIGIHQDSLNFSDDSWLVKLSATGAIEWQKCLGGSVNDWGSTVLQTNDYGFIAAGMTYSNDYDVSGNHGNLDAWVVKLSPACSPISLTSSIISPLCYGDSGSATISPQSGNPPFSFLWSNGDTTATSSGLSPGVYSVTVTDVIFCTATAVITIAQPAQLTANTTVTNSTCGNNNGSAVVHASGGTGAYTFNWSPAGGTDSTATGLASGIYTVTVTDASGCTISATAIISNTNGPVAALQSQQDVLCNGDSTGSAAISATGGASPYTYSWSPYGGTNTSASNLAAGNYTVVVTDSNFCTATLSVTINQPSSLTISVNSQNTTCGDNNGSATVNATGGAGAFVYNWSVAVGTDSSISGLGNGTYTILVTDANGCSQTQTVIISGPFALDITYTQHDDSCEQSIGEISTSVSGGTPAYTYLWNNGQSTSAISGLAFGTYTLTVTDVNSCTAVTQFRLENAPCFLIPNLNCVT